MHEKTQQALDKELESLKRDSDRLLQGLLRARLQKWGEGRIAIKFKLIMPARQGGYNAAQMSQQLQFFESVRDSAIKGVIRFTLRALLAGVLWGSYGICDQDELERRVSRVTSVLMGSTRATGVAQISVDVLSLTYARGNQRIPRLRLSTMGQPSFRQTELLTLIENAEFELTINVDLEQAVRALSRAFSLSLSETDVSALKRNIMRLFAACGPLALVLFGFGAIARRGFASCMVTEFTVEPSIDELNELAEMFRVFASQTADPDKEVRKARNILNTLLELACSSVNEIVKTCYPELQPRNPYAYPPCYVIVSPSIKQGIRRFDEAFMLELWVSRTRWHPMNLLALIGEATLKQQWKRLAGIPIQSPGGTLHTWVCGLPRSVGGRGYLNVRRFPSPILFRVLKLSHNLALLIVAGWFNEELKQVAGRLTHVGATRKRVNQYDVTTPQKQLLKFSPLTAFRAAWQFVSEYFIRQGFTSGGRVV